MASPHVSFDTLPASIRKPGKYFEFNTRLAVRTLPSNVQRVCIIAGKTDAGELPVNTPTEVYSDLEARLYAGPGSLGHLMCRAAIKAYPYIRLTLVTVDDAPAGLAATGGVEFAGEASKSGVVTLRIGSEAYRTAVQRNQAAVDTVAALVTLINAGQLSPVSAAADQNTPSTLVLTAKHKGLDGNRISLTLENTTEGQTAVLTPMTGGQVNPVLDEAFSSIFAAGHQVLIIPYTDAESLEAFRDHLDATGHALEQRGAVGIAAVTGTLAQAVTLAAGVNNGRVTMCLLPGTPSLPCEVAAAYGAVVSSEEDPARPLNTLELNGIAVPPLEKRLGRTEQETALYGGITPLEVGPGEKVQIVRAISTYTLDPQGIEDISLLDITTIRTLDYVRKACRERISLRFPREKLSSRTAPKVRSELIDVLLKLEDLEIVEEVKANLPGLVVERDSQDPNRLNAAIPCDVVNGLHVFAGRIDLLL
jgi:phage tail sheath gpL-like